MGTTDTVAVIPGQLRDSELPVRSRSLCEPLFKFVDVVLPVEEPFAVTKFPHLNADQYLIACEEANFVPPFLLGTSGQPERGHYRCSLCESD